MSQKLHFRNTNVLFNKKGSDKETNNNGTRFWNFFNKNNFFILNWRTQHDLEDLNTFKNISVLDLVFCSKWAFFKYVESLHADGF